MWRHRDHPVFTPLSGFFTGLVAAVLLPTVFGAVLSTMFSDRTTGELLPLSVVVLGIPLVLVAVPRTRRFGRYMLLGVVLTALVVLGVAALTLWILVSGEQ